MTAASKTRSLLGKYRLLLEQLVFLNIRVRHDLANKVSSKK